MQTSKESQPLSQSVTQSFTQSVSQLVLQLQLGRFAIGVFGQFFSCIFIIFGNSPPCARGLLRSRISFPITIPDFDGRSDEWTYISSRGRLQCVSVALFWPNRIILFRIIKQQVELAIVGLKSGFILETI